MAAFWHIATADPAASSMTDGEPDITTELRDKLVAAAIDHTLTFGELVSTVNAIFAEHIKEYNETGDECCGSEGTTGQDDWPDMPLAEVGSTPPPTRVSMGDSEEGDRWGCFVGDGVFIEVDVRSLTGKREEGDKPHQTQLST